MKCLGRAAISVTCIATLLLGEVQAEDTVPNPEYSAWASFKPGSFVRFQSSNQKKKAGPAIVRRLIAVAPEMATIEETFLEMKDGHEEIKTRRTYSVRARIPKHEVGGTALKEGDEVIEVKGTKYTCHWKEEGVADTEAGLTGLRKTWANSSIPGGVVRRDFRFNINKEGVLIAHGFEDNRMATDFSIAE